MVKNLKRYKKELERNEHYLAKDEVWGNWHMDFFPGTYIFPSSCAPMQTNTPSFWRSSRKILIPHGSSSPTTSRKVRASSCWGKSTSSKRLYLGPTWTPPSKTLTLTKLTLFPGTWTTRCWLEARSSTWGCTVIWSITQFWWLLTDRWSATCMMRGSPASATNCTVRTSRRWTTCSCIWRTWLSRSTAGSTARYMAESGHWSAWSFTSSRSSAPKRPRSVWRKSTTWWSCPWRACSRWSSMTSTASKCTASTCCWTRLASRGWSKSTRRPVWAPPPRRTTSSKCSCWRTSSKSWFPKTGAKSTTGSGPTLARRLAWGSSASCTTRRWSRCTGRMRSLRRGTRARCGGDVVIWDISDNYNHERQCALLRAGRPQQVPGEEEEGEGQAPGHAPE